MIPRGPKSLRALQYQSMRFSNAGTWECAIICVEDIIGEHSEQTQQRWRWHGRKSPDIAERGFLFVMLTKSRLVLWHCANLTLSCHIWDTIVIRM